MIKNILLLAVCILISACGNHSQDPANQPSAPASARSTASTTGANPLPEGIKPSFAYKIRAKSTAHNAGGSVEKLSIEFRNTDIASVDRELERVLAAKGYERDKKEMSAAGSLVGDYRKGSHEIKTTTTPVEKSTLKLSADSAGSVYFLWR